MSDLCQAAKSTPYRLRICAALALLANLVVVPLVRADPVDFRRAIDDCYDDSTPNSVISCYFTSGKLRMRWSSRDCVVEAASDAEAGSTSSALRWLKACACGDSDAVNAIDLAGSEAVEYARTNYSGTGH